MSSDNVNIVKVDRFGLEALTVFLESKRTLYAWWLRRGAPQNRAQRWLEEALDGEASKRDSHPSLSERLDALGEERRRALSRGVAPRYVSQRRQLVDLQASLIKHGL